MRSPRANQKGGRSSFASSSDRFLLIAAFLMGIAGLLFFKLIWHLDWMNAYLQTSPVGENDKLQDARFPSVMAASWTAIVLIGYAIIARKARWTEIEPETTGDNCYYLGFLFTLVSLAITLVQLGWEDIYGSRAVLVSIISGFGIALVSTIVGILLRVHFFQQRTDLVARQGEIANELNLAVRNFRSQVAASLVEIKKLSVQSVQIARERDRKLLHQSNQMLADRIDALKSIAQLTEEAQQGQVDKLKDVAGLLAISIERSFDRSADAMMLGLSEAARRSFSEAFSELDASISKASRAMDSMTARNRGLLNETSGALLRVNSGVTSFARALGSATANIEAQTALFADAITGAAKSIEESSRRVSTASDRISTAIGDAIQAKHDVEVSRELLKIATRVSGTLDEMAGIRKLAVAIVNQFGEDAKELNDKFNDVSMRLERIRMEDGATPDSWNIQCLKTECEEVGRKLQDISKSMHDLSDLVNNDTELNSRQFEELVGGIADKSAEIKRGRTKETEGRAEQMQTNRRPSPWRRDPK